MIRIVENKMATPTHTFNLVVRSRSHNFGLILRDPLAEPNQGGTEKTNIKRPAPRGVVGGDVRIRWRTVRVNLTKPESLITRMNAVTGNEMHQL